MIELNILLTILDKIKQSDIEVEDGVRMFKLVNGNYYNVDKLSNRTRELLCEFLEDYAI